MSIYANKIFAESEVEDSYNTPDEIGIDLDQVEEDIMGPDGIEAHRDEVEDAEEGTVGDAMDECYHALYESEYNFNQIMKCIGLNELASYANGRTVMMESADIKGWFMQVQNWIVKQFNNLMEIFNKAMNKMREFFDMDRRYANKYEKQIVEGCNMMKNDRKKFSGYDFIEGDPNTVFSTEVSGVDGDIIKSISKMSKKVGGAILSIGVTGSPDEKIIDDIKNNNENFDKNLIDSYGLSHLNITKLSEIQNALVKYLFNGQKKDLTPGVGILDAGDVVSRMKNNPVNAIKKQYNEAKKFYKNILGMVEDAKKVLLKDHADNNLKDKKIILVNTQISYIKSGMTVMFKCKCAFIKAYSARRNQDAAFAKKCVSYYNENLNSKNKKQVTSESFAFSAINFI